jgi:hypothetical protein
MLRERVGFRWLTLPVVTSQLLLALACALTEVAGAHYQNLPCFPLDFSDSDFLTYSSQKVTLRAKPIRCNSHIVKAIFFRTTSTA